MLLLTIAALGLHQTETEDWKGQLHLYGWRGWGNQIVWHFLFPKWIVEIKTLRAIHLALINLEHYKKLKTFPGVKFYCQQLWNNVKKIAKNYHNSLFAHINTVPTYKWNVGLYIYSNQLLLYTILMFTFRKNFTYWYRRAGVRHQDRFKTNCLDYLSEFLFKTVILSSLVIRVGYWDVLKGCTYIRANLTIFGKPISNWSNRQQ